MDSERSSSNGGIKGLTQFTQRETERNGRIYCMEVKEIFGELIGQEGVRRLLEGALANDKLAQTMIFAGPKGVGRKTAALLLARALHQDSQKTHPDTFIFSEMLKEMRERNRGIKDTVDEVIRFLQLSPITSKFKVAIIDGCEELSLAAQNALLKTLEEPREDTVLVLIVEDEKTLLPTIVSRSQVIRFGPLKDSEIEKRVANVTPEILKSAQGSLGFVLEMVKDAAKWEVLKKMQDFWSSVENKDTEDKFWWAEEMKSREDALDFLQIGAKVLREQLINQPDVRKSAKLARLQQAIYQIRDNVNPRAALEALLLVF